MSTEANTINVMWPFYNEISDNMIYWGWGPANNKEEIRIKFKTNIFLRFKDIMPVDASTFNSKPKCKNSNILYTNLVMKHLCVRPAHEILNKWKRRLPIESEAHLGYPKHYLIEYLEYLSTLEPLAPTTDKWIDGMEKEHGTKSFIDTTNLYMDSQPKVEMLTCHAPEISELISNKKILC